MKKSRLLITVGLWTAGLLILPSTSLFAAISPQIPMSLTQSDFDFSDLDARDSQNRKISSPAVKKQLENLFVFGFQRMFLNNLTPAKRDLLVRMGTSLKKCANWLTGSTAQLLTAVSAWVQKKFGLQIFVQRITAASLRPTMLSQWSWQTDGFASSLSTLLIQTTRLLR